MNIKSLITTRAITRRTSYSLSHWAFKGRCEDLVRVLSWSMQTLPCERSPSYECMPIFYGGALCITGSSTKVSQESSWNIPVPYNFKVLTVPRKPTHPCHIDSTPHRCLATHPFIAQKLRKVVSRSVNASYPKLDRRRLLVHFPLRS
jgi:hypothetical protein